jgi:hypothetical protein
MLITAVLVSLWLGDFACLHAAPKRGAAGSSYAAALEKAMTGTAEPDHWT